MRHQARASSRVARALSAPTQFVALSLCRRLCYRRRGSSPPTTLLAALGVAVAALSLLAARHAPPERSRRRLHILT